MRSAAFQENLGMVDLCLLGNLELQAFRLQAELFMLNPTHFEALGSLHCLLTLVLYILAAQGWC
jgi:hypothetical protein